MNEAAPVAGLLAATAIGENWQSIGANTGTTVFRLDLNNSPSALKSYPRVPIRELPRQILSSTLSAVEVLSGVSADPAPIHEDRLGSILFLAAGVTRGRRSSTGAPVWFRAAMSAGNLHPIELYLLDDGVWHYDPLLHRLEQVRPAVGTTVTQTITVVVTGIPARTCWKYAERGFRHLYWDVGTMLANLLAAANAYGVACSVSLGFDDADITSLLGIEPPDEVPIALVALGGPPQEFDDRGLGPIAWSRPITRSPIRFEAVSEALAASCLSAADVAPWREHLIALARNDTQPPIRLPPSDGSQIEDVILRRGSSRRFTRQSGSHLLFDWALPAATRSAPMDTSASGTHLGRLVHVHEVDATPPGSWIGGSRLELVAPSDAAHLRDVTARWCLGQDLGGDSFLTHFHSANLAQLFDHAGGRAYRVAAIESGIAVGRLALCAAALGVGATGLTFVDELVATELAAPSSCVFACAIGAPTTGPAPHGTPGVPYRFSGGLK
jgi:SagB-type dehydrogenase family enzyme